MKIKRLITLLGVTSGFFATIAMAADINVPAGNITADTTWTNDNTYILQGKVFVTNGATLEIEPGTIIKGVQSTGTDASALIITRDSMIMAEGTAEQPIIFTSELDNLDGTLTKEDVSLWGGVIVLGNAPINSRADGEPAGSPAEDQVEGIALGGIDPELATFGGTDPNDNSGVMQYVSIRHGGAVIGSDNEINGLTLGGVGDATTIEYIEVFANKDDGVEIFGGTVNVRYLALAFGADDGLDLDQGWTGSAQFIFVIGADIQSDRADKGGEWDGATSPLDAEPVSDYIVANATMIGIGDSLQPDGSTPGGSNTALNIRDTVRLRLFNSVFTDFAKGYDIENDIFGPTDGSTLGTVVDFPSEFGFYSNIFWSHISENNTPEGLNARVDGLFDPTVFFTDPTYGNEITNPHLRGISRDPDGGLDPRPGPGSAALVGAVAPPAGNTFLMDTDYRGAFDPEADLWLRGWTKLDEDGYLASADGFTIGSSELINISTRGFVGDGPGEEMVIGFVISGDTPMTVVVRGIGAGGLGVLLPEANLLDDPRIVVIQTADANGTLESNIEIGSNDNYADDPLLPLLEGTSLDPDSESFSIGEKDASLVLKNLGPGNYTIQVMASENSINTSGVVIAGADVLDN